MKHRYLTLLLAVYARVKGYSLQNMSPVTYRILLKWPWKLSLKNIGTEMCRWYWKIIMRAVIEICLVMKEYCKLNWDFSHVDWNYFKIRICNDLNPTTFFAICGHIHTSSCWCAAKWQQCSCAYLRLFSCLLNWPDRRWDILPGLMMWLKGCPVHVLHTWCEQALKCKHP